MFIRSGSVVVNSHHQMMSAPPPHPKMSVFLVPRTPTGAPLPHAMLTKHRVSWCCACAGWIPSWCCPVQSKVARETLNVHARRQRRTMREESIAGGEGEGFVSGEGKWDCGEILRVGRASESGGRTCLPSGPASAASVRISSAVLYTCSSPHINQSSYQSLHESNPSITPSINPTNPRPGPKG